MTQHCLGGDRIGYDMNAEPSLFRVAEEGGRKCPRRAGSPWDNNDASHIVCSSISQLPLSKVKNSKY